MSSFDIQQGGRQLWTWCRRVLEGIRADGPGFSLCAVPLELSGPGFCGMEQRLGERAEVQRCQVPEHNMELVQRTGVDGRDLASTYVLCPLTIALSQISE